jgi:predicted nuclease of predicted toxin-antitoxin system
MKFIVDAQLPKSLARLLRNKRRFDHNQIGVCCLKGF